MMDKMEEETVKNAVASTCGVRISSEALSDVQLHYFHGTRLNEMVAKKSAAFLAKNYPQVKIQCFRGYSHCEMALRNEEAYKKTLDAALRSM